MPPTSIVVEGLVPTADEDTNLRTDAWSIGLDQRAFGPRRLVVACADRTGRLVGLAHTPRIHPAELAIGPCIQFFGRSVAAAVAFCDEPLRWGPPPADLGERFALDRSVAAAHGTYLVDWFACDDQLIRSTRMALEPGTEWWDVPDLGGHV